MKTRSLPSVGDRIVKTLSVKLDVEANVDDRVITGYASVFDVLDNHGDIVRRGAFEESIRDRFDKVKVLWQHKSDEPIGRPVHMAEDSKGLLTVSKISKTSMGDDALRLIADKVVDSFSIGFQLQKFTEFEDEELRAQLTGFARMLPMLSIEKVKLFEYSPVTFPANEDAAILAVRHFHGGWTPVIDVSKALESRLSSSSPDSKAVEVGSFVTFGESQGLVLSFRDSDKTADVQVYDGTEPTDEIRNVPMEDLSETEIPVPEPEPIKSENVAETEITAEIDAELHIRTTVGDVETTEIIELEVSSDKVCTCGRPYVETEEKSGAELDELSDLRNAINRLAELAG